MASSDNNTQSIRRPPIKAWHSHWKHKLREGCLQRVEKNRNQILWKIRLNGQALPTSQEAAKIAFGDILVDEFHRLKQRVKNENSHDPDTIMLWEYEPSEAITELGNDGYEELMIAMQNILHEEMHLENNVRDTLLLEDFEKSCEQEDHALSTMLEQLQSNEIPYQSELSIFQKDGLACPICKVGKLLQNQHLIYCSCCHLRLDVQHEKVNLDFLRGRLEELLQQHLDSGCKGWPVFCTDNRFSIMALYIQCSSCETFELVL